MINAVDSDDPIDPSHRLATMHRVKGFEFDQLSLPGLTADQLPLRFVLDGCPDELSRQHFEQQERSSFTWRP